MPGIVSGGPRRRKGLRADPPGRDGGLGEEFSAPRPGRTDQGFGDWATAPDQSCACVNCMLSTNPGSASQCGWWLHPMKCIAAALCLHLQLDNSPYGLKA